MPILSITRGVCESCLSLLPPPVAGSEIDLQRGIIHFSARGNGSHQFWMSSVEFYIDSIHQLKQAPPWAIAEIMCDHLGSGTILKNDIIPGATSGLCLCGSGFVAMDLVEVDRGITMVDRKGVVFNQVRYTKQPFHFFDIDELIDEQGIVSTLGVGSILYAWGKLLMGALKLSVASVGFQTLPVDMVIATVYPREPWMNDWQYEKFQRDMRNRDAAKS